MRQEGEAFAQSAHAGSTAFAPIERGQAICLPRRGVEAHRLPKQHRLYGLPVLKASFPLTYAECMKTEV